MQDITDNLATTEAESPRADVVVRISKNGQIEQYAHGSSSRSSRSAACVTCSVAIGVNDTAHSVDGDERCTGGGNAFNLGRSLRRRLTFVGEDLGTQLEGKPTRRMQTTWHDKPYEDCIQRSWVFITVGGQGPAGEKTCWSDRPSIFLVSGRGRTIIGKETVMRYIIEIRHRFGNGDREYDVTGRVGTFDSEKAALDYVENVLQSNLPDEQFHVADLSTPMEMAADIAALEVLTKD